MGQEESRGNPLTSQETRTPSTFGSDDDESVVLGTSFSPEQQQRQQQFKTDVCIVCGSSGQLHCKNCNKGICDRCKPLVALFSIQTRSYAKEQSLRALDPITLRALHSTATTNHTFQSEDITAENSDEEDDKDGGSGSDDDGNGGEDVPHFIDEELKKKKKKINSQTTKLLPPSPPETSCILSVVKEPFQFDVEQFMPRISAYNICGRCLFVRRL